MLGPWAHGFKVHMPKLKEVVHESMEVVTVQGSHYKLAKTSHPL